MSQAEASQVVAPRGGSWGWVYVTAFVLALALFGAGIALAVRENSYAMLAAGCASVVLVLVSWPIATLLGRLERMTGRTIAEACQPLAQTNQTLQLIAEQQLISDRAKAVAFRDRDRDAFKRAIHEDVAKQDYDAALAMVEAMDREFGAQSESSKLREDVLARRDDAIRRQLDAALVVVDRHVAAEQWQAAFKEAERLAQLYPNQTRALELPAEIEARRQDVKRRLQARLFECDRAGHTDEGINVLKKLDFYLTPVEANGLEEIARRLFKTKLTQLGDAFRHAAGARDWKEAVRIAHVIAADFPNSQMAREAKEMLPSLEQRAREEAGTRDPVGAGV